MALIKHVLLLSTAFFSACMSSLGADGAALYESDFRSARYGCIPDGWSDLVAERPTRIWGVDGNGLLGAALKWRTGLLVYAGYTADVKPAHALTDTRIVAEFKKTEDVAVTFGVAARVADKGNFYMARFSGADRLE